MDFDLNDDQVMLRESAARFLKSEYTAERRMKAIHSSHGHDKEMWGRFAEFGWLGLPLSEDVGGLGGSPVDLMVLMECFGEALVVEPYLGSIILAGRLLDAAGSGDQRQRLLPDVVAGKKTLALAFAEPESRFSLNVVRTVAKQDGDGFVITGRKAMVLNGAAADHMLVLTRTEGDIEDRNGLSLFLVDAAAGATTLEYRNVDGTGAADIIFDNLRVGGDALVGKLGEALPHVEETIAFATLAVAARAVGSMDATNRITTDYLKTRKQFGAPIGSFQALQHRMVDMIMAFELAKSVVIAAAIKMQENADDRLKFISAAKYECGRAGKFIGKNAVQLHGGIGVSQEYVIGHYFKHLLADDILFGDSSYHAGRYSSLAQ